MRTKTLWIIALPSGVVAVALAALLAMPRPSAHAAIVASAPSGSSSAPGDTSDLERQMSALRREMDSLKREKATAPVPQGAPSAEPGKDEAAPPREASEDERRQALTERHQRAAAQLQKHLRSTARDAEWTSTMEREVATAIPAGSGSAVEGVECHASLCMVSIAHKDKEALDRFRGDLSQGLSYDMDILMSPDGDGFKSEVFLAKEIGGMPDWRHEMEQQETL